MLTASRVKLLHGYDLDTAIHGSFSGSAVDDVVVVTDAIDYSNLPYCGGVADCIRLYESANDNCLNESKTYQFNPNNFKYCHVTCGDASPEVICTAAGEAPSETVTGDTAGQEGYLPMGKCSSNLECREAGSRYCETTIGEYNGGAFGNKPNTINWNGWGHNGTCRIKCKSFKQQFVEICSKTGY
ncbi:hypothetical protein TrST_g11846 [Triparma strigata]|uniref:Uncharacterized protein n=1 Tax=Triparma strigata TaxID=1606541 RepID=A0A9W7EJK2_9STRA|nr:hypothetical protein TrST_g11846 [Triparma strigata]